MTNPQPQDDKSMSELKPSKSGELDKLLHIIDYPAMYLSEEQNNLPYMGRKMAMRVIQEQAIQSFIAEKERAARWEGYSKNIVNCDVCGQPKEVATDSHNATGESVGAVCLDCFNKIFNKGSNDG